MIRRRGFTLLEVMVSVAILALILTALTGVTTNSFDSSNYANHLTIATLLARSKMLDVETELMKDGFGDTEKEFSGDFSEEGYPKFKWIAICRPIEVDIGQLVGNLFGGDIDGEEFPKQMEEYIKAFTGGVDGVNPDLAQQVGTSQFSQLMKGGALETIFKQVGETLKNGIREITLEITWPDGEKSTESVKFVQYVAVDRPSLQQNLAPPRLPAGPDGQPLPGHRTPGTLSPTLGGQPLVPNLPSLPPTIRPGIKP